MLYFIDSVVFCRQCCILWIALYFVDIIVFCRQCCILSTVLYFDVLINVIVSSVVDCGLEPLSGQTTEYNIGMFFSGKHTAQMSRRVRNILFFSK